MSFVDDYLLYIETVRRYSPRTVSIYAEILGEYFSFYEDITPPQEALEAGLIRSYQVHLLDERRECARTVNLHLSVLSGLCRYLLKNHIIAGNPVSLVKRPRSQKRLPQVYRDESLEAYFKNTEHCASVDSLDLLQAEGVTEFGTRLYEERLRRLIILLLSGTGIRRSELISLKYSSVDFGRRRMKVVGKGDKMREIPLVDSLCEELLLYLEARRVMIGKSEPAEGPLLVTAKGSALYPVYVDRAVKKELGTISGITGRKSPHVLRHTLATQLLDDGTPLNSIKELLGHSSLAATQVYTHNSISKLRNVYNNAHPRAKNGGKNGD